MEEVRFVKKILASSLALLLILIFVGCKEKKSISSESNNGVSITNGENSEDETSNISSNTHSSALNQDKPSTGKSNTTVSGVTSDSEETVSSETEEIVTTSIIDVVEVYEYDDKFVIPTSQAFSFHDYSTGNTIPYRLFLPKNYSASKKYPVLLFLHGLGEVGTDNESQIPHFQQAFKVAGDLLSQAIIILPQSSHGWGDVTDQYSDLSSAKRLLDCIINEYNGDRNRIYVTGLSLGGYATWNMLENYGNFFAAGVPVCGWGNTSAASVLANIPIWVFHGTNDTTVNISSSEAMVRAISNAGGGMIEFTRLNGIAHNAWDYAYTNREMFCWMFSQNLETHQSYTYDYIEYFKVTAPDNKVLLTEKDILFVSHMSLDGKQFIEVEIENSSFEVLKKAYKENIGKTFTVFYGSEKLYTFKFLSEPKDCLFYIENVMSDEDFQSLAINLKRINKKFQYG